MFFDSELSSNREIHDGKYYNLEFLSQTYLWKFSRKNRLGGGKFIDDKNSSSDIIRTVMIYIPVYWTTTYPFFEPLWTAKDNRDG